MLSQPTDTAPAPDPRAPRPAPVPAAPADEGAAPAPESGGRGGLDPVRYGDWEKNGRCIDF